jgi:ubiquinone/menaquinone biosynthesis C-methylase UbiE
VRGSLTMDSTAAPRPPGRAPAIAAEFTARAPRYETDRLAPWYQAQASLVLGHLGPTDGPLLDVGCGTGWLIRDLLRRHPSTRGVGVDLAPGMITEARRLAADEKLKGAAFVLADWEEPGTEERIRRLLPGGAGAVVCISTLHYFRDPAAALARMHRLLAPEGRLLLVERRRERSPLTGLWDLLHRTVIRDHVRFYRERELLSLMTRAGFRDPAPLARVRRWLWKGKLFTSLVLLEGQAGGNSRLREGPTSDKAFAR